MRVLIAEDDVHMQLAIQSCVQNAGYEAVVVSDGLKAVKALENPFDLIISDQRMPNMTGQELLTYVREKFPQIPFVMITAHGTITQAVEAMQAGAADFITKPFSAEDLERVIERVLSPEQREYRSAPRSSKGKAIITNDPYMIRVLEVVEAVAKSDATILVQGESGTGKELIARMVHQVSPRAEQPFIAVNCAALPANLLESELFGHEKGAFTGAEKRKLGKFELAHGGTILLDEISEMELGLQAKLLRVLQEREVDRVGGSSPIPVDVRVVATTNRNLAKEVEEGRFRADLYYRLNVIPLTLTPLRERQNDIPLLVEHFMRKVLGAGAPKIPAETMRTLMQYPWPGNVRELQNAVERAAILAQGRSPEVKDFLITAPSTLAQKIEQETVPSIRSGMTVAEVEKLLILETLKATGDNRTKAADLLGISIRTLRNKLAEYRVE
jgi:DNA-binding NtrC family response regulator